MILLRVIKNRRIKKSEEIIPPEKERESEKYGDFEMFSLGQPNLWYGTKLKRYTILSMSYLFIIILLTLRALMSHICDI